MKTYADVQLRLGPRTWGINCAKENFLRLLGIAHTIIALPTTPHSATKQELRAQFDHIIIIPRTQVLRKLAFSRHTCRAMRAFIQQQLRQYPLFLTCPRLQLQLAASPEHALRWRDAEKKKLPGGEGNEIYCCMQARLTLDILCARTHARYSIDSSLRSEECGRARPGYSVQSDQPSSAPRRNQQILAQPASQPVAQPSPTQHPPEDPWCNSSPAYF